MYIRLDYVDEDALSNRSFSTAAATAAGLSSPSSASSCSSFAPPPPSSSSHPFLSLAAAAAVASAAAAMTSTSSSSASRSLLAPAEQRGNALRCLSFLCENKLVVASSHLKRLLCERDLEGCTPFMAAVKEKAYSAALTLLDAARRIAAGESDEKTLMMMVCPDGTHPDDSPLFVLCCNDTCSFTWTGASHVKQVVYGRVSIGRGKERNVFSIGDL